MFLAPSDSRKHALTVPESPESDHGVSVQGPSPIPVPAIPPSSLKTVPTNIEEPPPASAQAVELEAGSSSREAAPEPPQTDLGSHAIIKTLFDEACEKKGGIVLESRTTGSQTLPIIIS